MPRQPTLTVDREEARQKIRQEIEKWKAILELPFQTAMEAKHASTERDKGRAYTSELLRTLFENSEVPNEFGRLLGKMLFGHEGLRELRGDHVRVCQSNIDDLESILNRLELFQTARRKPQGVPAEPGPRGKRNSRVFVVHGHDEALKQEVARLLGKLDLDPILLSEQADKGRTIIEKFEEHSDVAYAIVLLSPDDEGRPKATDDLEPRARQNVIFELGFFFGKLGRKNVCALVKEGVEFPSDIHGVIYKSVDSAGAWKLELAKEMKAAGLSADLNKLA